jgi:vancomycin resistance protein VanJ
MATTSGCPSGYDFHCPNKSPSYLGGMTQPNAVASRGARFFRFFRTVVTFLSHGYVFGLTLLLLMMMWWGERHWLLSLLLFAPVGIFVLPFAALTPLCLVFRWRLVAWHVGCLLFLFFGYMSFRWHSPPKPAQKTMVVVTHNAGQGNREQFASFLARHKPEFIVVQDSKTAGPLMSRTFPDRYISARGEFLLVSSHPIRRAELLDHPRWGKRAVAARFEVVREGKPLVIYNVHLPTPRNQFNRVLSLRAFGDLLGDEEPGPGFLNYRDWIAARIRLARDLDAVFAAEKEPYIACGDFNTPDHGYIYGIFKSRMADAHLYGGRGWGLTFPGSTRNPISLFRPWLRIDYAFAGTGWRPVYCQPGPPGRAQHRPVVAHFVPSSS